MNINYSILKFLIIHGKFMVIYVFKKQEDASGEIGHFCHCLIKIRSTKKRKIGENKRQKTEKGCEKMTFRTLFFVKA